MCRSRQPCGLPGRRGRDILAATESDLVAFKKIRTQLQERPIGPSAWGKESGLPRARPDL
ncbi:hypothetical protein ACH4RG_35300 [Streptomyces sp. NPDC021019]|uniref:hypothetical protein n=1 Tax=Streptomyces sp. NPDC021019 TaxID=3365108 RepID=UPI0037AA47CD